MRLACRKFYKKKKMQFWLSCSSAAFIRLTLALVSVRSFWSLSDHHDRVCAASESPDLRWVWSSHGTPHTHTRICPFHCQKANNTMTLWRLINGNRYKCHLCASVSITWPTIVDKESNLKKITNVERLMSYTCIETALKNKKICNLEK